MDLRKIILAEHSKKQTQRILSWVGTDQKRFDELFTLFLGNEYRVTQRAAWSLSFCVIAHPELIKKHWKKLVTNLARPGIHGAVKRNTLRLLQHMAIPVKYHGEIMNRCFSYVTDPKEAIAIKAFALTILGNLSKSYPDIRQELLSIIEAQWDQATPAFRSRAKKIIGRIKP